MSFFCAESAHCWTRPDPGIIERSHKAQGYNWLDFYSDVMKTSGLGQDAEPKYHPLQMDAPSLWSMLEALGIMYPFSLQIRAAAIVSICRFNWIVYFAYAKGLVWQWYIEDENKFSLNPARARIAGAMNLAIMWSAL